MNVTVMVSGQQSITVSGILVLDIPGENLNADDITDIIASLDPMAFIYDVPHWEFDDDPEPDAMCDVEFDVESLKRADDDANVGVVKDGNDSWQRVEVQL